MNLPLAVTIGGILTLLANCGAVESQSPGEYSALTVSNIAARIRLQAEATKPLGMNSYTNSIPDSRATYSMVAIPGGEFVMGSPVGGRYFKPDQSPPHRVKLDTFWIGKYEVTWNEFNSFMLDDIDRRQSSPPPSSGKLESGQADAITHPSLPFVDMSFGMGKSGYPAIGMTQHAANKYCQWLSAKTGHFYRLPTEAEWEYAARSGSTNIWFFGDAPSKLSDYAWFEDNSDMKYQKVGRKLPNAWGLHDVLGNVSEWVLDQYDDVFYRRCAEEGSAVMPWNRASRQYPHSVRGGSWRDPIQEVHCAVRGQSTPDWKMGDPQMPKSKFWLRNCDFVGFRIVRPRAIPTTEQMGQYWNSGVERE
ncbi:MAG: formylglycine-generating enzyme family protein [Verrucomicrobia bacterium]|nr:formylglycine-generating enzyme family protein [Verrucomicrobiota bacterium]